MANKFIALVVFVAVAQASLAAADVNSAREQTRTAWRGWAETLCKAVSQKSWSIADATEEYRKNQAAGAAPYWNVARDGKDQKLQKEATALGKTFREALFKAVSDARACKNSATTIAEIEKNKNSLPYTQLVDNWHKLAGKTGSTGQGVNQLKTVYAKLYAEVEKLAKVTCGGEKSLGACATNDIHGATDALANTIYTFVQ